MTENNSAIPRSFWIVSGAALVWNVIGINSYVMQVTMTEDALMALPEAQRALYENIPAWATAAYAIAVNAGVVGSLLLLFKSSWALPVFVISLAGIFVQMFHGFVVTNLLEVLGPTGAILPSIIVAVGLALIWYAREAKEKGWIS